MFISSIYSARFKRFVHSIYTSILSACREMATQTNLLGFFGKVVNRKRKSQTSITSFFKKADQNHEKNDDIIYVGGMYFLLTILLQDDAEYDPFIL